MTRIAVAVLCAAASAVSAAPFESSGIVDWTAPPPPSAESAFIPPTAKRIVLSNGMTMVAVENHRLPIVAISIVVLGAGSASDPTDKPGVAAFAADLLDEGASGLSAIQIAEQQDQLGAQIAIETLPDAAQISITTLTKTLAPTLQLVGKVVTNPAFAAADFERVKGDRATALELRRDRPREVARNVLLGALYGPESPYGHPGAGLPESFAAIRLEDIQAFYRQRWSPAATTVVVVGDIEPESVRRLVETELGAWRGVAIAIPKPAVAASPTAQRLRVADRPGAAQSDIRIGTIGIDRHDPQFFAFEVLSAALGGSFSSRLMQRLREQLGITYTARASQTYLRSRGPFEIATSIVTSATGRGIEETLRIVRGLATQPVSGDELERVQLNLIRALPESFEDNNSTAQAFADLALFDLPMDFYATYANGIRSVTAKDVLAVATSAISDKAMIVSVVGDAAKIRGQLGKLRLGKPMMYRPDGILHPAAGSHGTETH